MIEEGVDFIYLFPAGDPKSVHIKLLTGPFEGAVYKYGNVKFEEKDDVGYLHFDYDVIQYDKMKPKKLEKNDEFKNYIGDFLVEILKNRMIEGANESGTTDIEESDL
jgi:hypothetical protein